MPRLFRAMVSLAHASGLPRDRVVNTFHVLVPDGGPATPAEGIAEDVRDFYVTSTGHATELMDAYSASISGSGHEVRMYELDIESGDRIPYLDAPPTHVEVFDFLGVAARATADSLPGEVACCLSMANVGSSPVPQAQRRGRVYIGPLLEQYKAYTGNAVRPSATLIAMLNGHGNALVDRLRARLGAEGGLVVYSRPFAGRPETPRPGRTTLPELPPRPGAAYLVNQLSVDDSLDTVRRRGERALTRTTIVA